MKNLISFLLSISILSTQAYALEVSAEIEMIKSIDSYEQLLDSVDLRSEELLAADKMINGLTEKGNAHSRKHQRILKKLTKGTKRLEKEIDKQVDAFSDEELLAKIEVEEIDSSLPENALRAQLKKQYVKSMHDSLPQLADEIIKSGGFYKFTKKMSKKLKEDSKEKSQRGPASGDPLCSLWFGGAIILSIVLISIGLGPIGIALFAIGVFPGGLIIAFSTGACTSY